ncbi:uncharacterized protein LOC126336640 isoform X2 [Schistocerca gregaria]|uniref:uncharacterized protein LOC126336640 isoform X2 n=1 Tax=Schistocerca gregaria TaxID=7010 RepID=UPI00211F1497|nr:uncharacterized protein LOC126336640 isoform X2 [Schistocerca gregaria]
MDSSTIVEGPVKFRDGKKWKCRWCVMRKLSPVADCLHLQLYRDSKERYKQGHTKASLSLQHFLAVETGFTLDKESNTIAIICQDVTVILAFDSRERQMQWHVKIVNNLGEGQQFLVQVTSAPPRAKICMGPARLHVQERRFCLTSGVPPRLLGFWDISQLRRYGVVEGRFVFEGGSRCGKGEGVHVCVTDQAADITAAFQQAAQGSLASRRRAMLRSAPATDSPRRRIRNQQSVETDSPQPSTAHPHSTLRDIPGEQLLCSCSKTGEDSNSQSWTASEITATERCTQQPLDNIGGHQFAASPKDTMTCRHSYHRQTCKIFQQHVTVHSRSDGVSCSKTAVQEHFQNNSIPETQSILFNPDSNRRVIAGAQLCHCRDVTNICHLTDNETSGTECKPFHLATHSSLEKIMQHSPFKRLYPIHQQQVCTVTSQQDPLLMSKSYPTGDNTSVLPTFNTAQGIATCNLCLNRWHCSSQTICAHNSSSQNSASPNFSNRNKLTENPVPVSLGAHVQKLTLQQVSYKCRNNTEFIKQDRCIPNTITDGASDHNYDIPSTFTENICSEVQEGSDESMTGDTVMEDTEDTALKVDCGTPKKVHKLCEPVVVPGASSFGGNYDTVPRTQTSRMPCKCFLRPCNKITSISNPLKLTGQGTVNKNTKEKYTHGNCPCQKVMFWAGNFMTLPYCRRGNGMEDTGTSSRCAGLDLHEMMTTSDTSNTTALYATVDKSKKRNRETALRQKCYCSGSPCVCQKAITEKTYGGNLTATSTTETGFTNLETGQSDGVCEAPNAPSSEDRYYENMGFADSLEYYENVKDVLKKAGIEQDKVCTPDTNMQANREQDNKYIISSTDPSVVRVCEKCGHHFQAENFSADSPDKVEKVENLMSSKQEKSVSDDYLMMLPGKDLLLHPGDNSPPSSPTENLHTSSGPRDIDSVQNIPSTSAHDDACSNSADGRRGKHYHTPCKIPTVYFNQAQEPDITVCDIPLTSMCRHGRNNAETSLSDSAEFKTQENLKKCKEQFACDCGRVTYSQQICTHPNSDESLELHLWNTFPQRKQPSHARQSDCTGSLPKCMNNHFSHRDSLKEKPVENERHLSDSLLLPVHIRRSSSVPCKPVNNRDSSSSNDSGVAVDLILLKARNLSQTENLSALINHSGYDTKCLHYSLPRRSKSVDPVKNSPLCFQKSVATAKCSPVEVTGPTYQKVSVSGSPEGENSVAIPYIDSQSVSSGTSNISDYMDTLSLCSHSSSDVQDGRRLGRQAATTLRPRSGKEYQLIDRYVLEGDIQLTG